jgi:deazaflavin-dependent oxidoreductase (nitroreductase family)
MLTSPIRDGEAIVVVASRGGDDRHPDWLLNLQAEPRVEVALRGGPRRPMLARVAAAAERERLWKEIIAFHPRYAGYQRRTSREIPVVLLLPIAG